MEKPDRHPCQKLYGNNQNDEQLLCPKAHKWRLSRATFPCVGQLSSWHFISIFRSWKKKVLFNVSEDREWTQFLITQHIKKINHKTKFSCLPTVRSVKSQAPHGFLPFSSQMRSTTTCHDWSQGRCAGTSWLAQILHQLGNQQQLGLCIKRRQFRVFWFFQEQQSFQYLCLNIDQNNTVTKYNNLANWVCAQTVSKFGNTIIHTSPLLAFTVFYCGKPFGLLISKSSQIALSISGDLIKKIIKLWNQLKKKNKNQFSDNIFWLRVSLFFSMHILSFIGLNFLLMFHLVTFLILQQGNCSCRKLSKSKYLPLLALI